MTPEAFEKCSVIQDEQARLVYKLLSDLNTHPTKGEPMILKTCPFCDCEPTMRPWHGGGPNKVMIACENDPGCDVLPGVTGKTPEEAGASWNNRA